MLAFPPRLMRRFLFLCGGICLVLLMARLQPSQGAETFPLSAKRILFLGDSITHAGKYINEIEAQLRLQQVEPQPELINLGLSSETCSGLSEAKHPFPRPDVHTRLDKALELIPSDVVVACYGINDGIYAPFSQERFQAYQNGVNRLIEKVQASGAKLILMTPPPFDPVPLQGTDKLISSADEPLEKYAYFAMYENYDTVMQRYAQWIRQQKNRVAMVIDLHQPITAALTTARKKEPKFSFTTDGIHPNAAGHRVMAETILRAWEIDGFEEPSVELLQKIAQKNSLLHAARLTQVGHSRPGVKEGLPIQEAERKAAAIETDIAPLVKQGQQSRTQQQKTSGGTLYQVHYPPIAQPGELRISADYYLWIPEGVETLRGVIVHQHGCGEGACTGGQTAAEDWHWQELARKWNCALMGSSYQPREGYNCRLWCDPRNGSGERFLQALTQFSQQSKHSEIETIPWCLWGHSGGGFWSSLMQTKHPERIVAIWLQSGSAFPYWSRGEIETPEISAEAYQVPVLACPGGKEKNDSRFHIAWEGSKQMQEAYRKQGATFFEFAPDPLTGHQCGDSRYLAIPFFDFWLSHRLPATNTDSQQLQPVTAAVLADWNKRLAPQLQEFVEKGSVSDTTPPAAPTAVQIERKSDGSVQLTWTAAADFESGIRGFVIERNGEKIAQVPEHPVGRFGRPLMQTMSYHDTPERPLPQMEFLDQTAAQHPDAQYSVRTINSVKLVSEPTAAQ